ncbi:Ribosomal protein YmL35 [Pleurostoma richardsiae]|uniref:Large ribosomal subunit protein mL38 n=1 Tax=Pleurostoma richardsiae TaxID=41990 RepID=A0AA38RV51_9PEZI|nr:Ribosomal protein YmL35 [Pleurostoma richardsiae]
MSRCQQVGRPIARYLQQQGLAAQSTGPAASSIAAARHFSRTAARADVEPTTSSTPSGAADDLVAAGLAQPPPSGGAKHQLLDPNTTTLPWAEKELMRKGVMPVGSRRRRAAVRTSANVPFEQLPYQCFQEARKVLQADREEKLAKIREELDKIRRLEATDASKFRDGEYHKQKKLGSLRRYVEELKILADINDPLVKRKFEDGLGDMTKPIYRYLAERRWREMPYKIIKQRVEQFHIVPDVLPKFDPTADVQLYFRQRHVAPGEFVDSLVSEVPPRLRVQVFEKDERLVSVVVMDSDVPVPDQDGFARRCHYLAANIPVGPTTSSLPLAKADAEAQLAVPWLPPFSQKGAPYHRLSVFLLEQKAGERLDVAKLRELYAGRDGFSLKSFRDKFGLKPFGFNIFRTVWDDGTAAVMERHGIPGADVEFRRQKVEPLKPPKKARGWEAKRQGPKYKHLWKYTKRIGPMSGGR